LRAEPVTTAGGGEILHPVDHHQVAFAVDIAGVAGGQPAVAQVGLRRRLVAVIAEEHVGMAGDDLADAVRVRRLDPQLDVAVEADPDRVEIDVAFPVDGVGAQEFGLAVQLAQRHAHGEEEAEGLRPQRRPAGRGRTQPGEAQPVAQRGEEQDFRER